MNRPVLIVDDSLTVRMDLSAAFEEAGMDTRVAETIAEARAVLEKEDVGVVVLDVLLPDGDGVDLLAELRATPEGQAMAILMLSTEAEVKDRIRGLRTGADEYVGKPYDAKHVVAAARRLRRPGKPPNGKTTVLLIDDSLTYRETMGDVFRDAGYTVLSAASGEEGLGTVAVHRPSVVIVDGNLPGMDGATVIRRVRLDAALRGIPCILLTGAEDKGAELMALEAGADAFLRKEEEAEIILARTAAVLRGASPTSHGEIGSLHGPHKVLAVDDSKTSSTRPPTCFARRATMWSSRSRARRRLSCSRCSRSTASCST